MFAFIYHMNIFIIQNVRMIFVFYLKIRAITSPDVYIFVHYCKIPVPYSVKVKDLCITLDTQT